jgi:hypothetical protein
LPGRQRGPLEDRREAINTTTYKVAARKTNIGKTKPNQGRRLGQRWAASNSAKGVATTGNRLAHSSRRPVPTIKPTDLACSLAAISSIEVDQVN